MQIPEERSKEASVFGNIDIDNLAYGKELSCSPGSMPPTFTDDGRVRNEHF
jgi:hypothetical protein